MMQTTTPPAAMPSILQKIITTKEAEITAAKKTKDFNTVKQAAIELYERQTNPRRGFANALRQQQISKHPAVIAEIKKASPSKGIISPNFDAAKTALQYESAGATCLSVLTDEPYFQGSNQYLQMAKDVSQLPILRKDFMIDAYQIYESYLLGADCILLIVACLNDEVLHRLHQIACQLGMDVLIEVHTQAELERALKLPDLTAHQSTDSNNRIGQNIKVGQNIYGINNRDLHTFETDLNTSLSLKARFDSTANASISSPLLVTESGIHSADDMHLMLDNDIYCFLIGEQFMKTQQPGETLSKLIETFK